jgi:FkbH-like protein
MLKSNFDSEPYKIKVLSNITVNQIKEILEYSLRVENIFAEVSFGDYDNIIQESQNCSETDLVIVFWELCNLVEGFYYKSELLNEKQLKTIFEKTIAEIDFIWKNISRDSLLIFNKFSDIHFSTQSIKQSKLAKLASQLNSYIEQKTSTNVITVNIEKIISQSSLSHCVSIPHFYNTKMLYTLQFFKLYTESIKCISMSANGKARKILVLDCDNTLWKGILGEDGFNNIEMSSGTRDGRFFNEAQAIVVSLFKSGILIGLCSKNNEKDVDRVLTEHPNILLKPKHISIKKINWQDKASNIKEISKDLNIGLDSIVFVDDSLFEINLIKSQLPEVKTLHVPENLLDYPQMLRDNLSLFFNLSQSEEDRKKTEMYKQQLNRVSAQKQLGTIDEYLASLCLKLQFYKDNKSIISRMAQLTQKTNQFNLTTKRYTEGDIKRFIKSADSKIIACSVSDKFGDSGVTGLAIVNLDKCNKTASIDTFLLSCRVIGRNIEQVFFDYLVTELKNIAIKTIYARYSKTQKNSQVSEFYTLKGFKKVENNKLTENTILYKINIKNYKNSTINYIEQNET